MKNRLPKAQKGLAKLAKIVKTASKTSGNTAKKMMAKPIVRKAGRITNAQKSLSASALSGMTASQLRSKLSSLMKEASAVSKAKGTGKALSIKQKGGSIGVKPPASLKPKGKEKRRLKKNDRRAERWIKQGGDKASINQMREMAKGPLKGTIATKRQTKKYLKKHEDELSKPVVPLSKAKMQKGGVVGTKKKKVPSALKSYLSKPKQTTIRPKSVTGKPPVPKEATSRRARKKSGKMLTAITGNPPRSKRQLLKKKPGMGLILPKKQKGGVVDILTPAHRTPKTKKDLKKAARKNDKTVTSRSGLITKVNKKGAPKKNQGGGRPMSAKKAIRKMNRKKS